MTSDWLMRTKSCPPQKQAASTTAANKEGFVEASPSLRTRFTENVLRERDAVASAKPFLLAAVVEAARSWGGQLFVLSRIKLMS